jgi:trehalose/maltose hydrolase-like predicted phosphorylase
MGYKLKSDELELMKKNYNYYIERTSHGSTLSYVVHTAILTYFPDHEGHNYWNWYMKALGSDLYDIQGGTTLEGIHTGVMGGTIDIIYKSFAGINLFKDKISIEPDLPDHWKKLKFRIKFHGKWIHIEIDRDKIYVENEMLKDLSINHCGKDYSLEKGKLEINYKDKENCD